MNGQRDQQRQVEHQATPISVSVWLGVFRTFSFRTKKHSYETTISCIVGNRVWSSTSHTETTSGVVHPSCCLFNKLLSTQNVRFLTFRTRNFPVLMLQWIFHTKGRGLGYQHSFVASYCILSCLPSLVAVSALQTKIRDIWKTDLN